MGRVLVLGGSNTDLVCRAPRLPVPGETLNGTSFSVYAGGKGANQAVAAARAGARVSFFGAIGTDEFGQQRRTDLERDGIDLTHLSVISGASSGVALIAVDDRGENQIIVVDGANGLVSNESIDAAIDDGPWDVLLVVLEVPFEIVRETITRLAGKCEVILNAAPFDERAAELLPMVDVLICNEIEAAGLLQREVTHDSALSDAVDLQTLGPAHAVITLGANGVAAAGVADSWHEPARPAEVIDTTGAGDSFCGALAAWLSEGKSLREAVRAGAVAGALAVAHAGAQPSLPTRAEIERLLA